MSSGDDLVGAHNGAAAHQGTTDSTGEHDLRGGGGEDQEDVDLDDKKMAMIRLMKLTMMRRKGNSGINSCKRKGL